MFVTSCTKSSLKYRERKRGPKYIVLVTRTIVGTTFAKKIILALVNLLFLRIAIDQSRLLLVNISRVDCRKSLPKNRIHVLLFYLFPKESQSEFLSFIHPTRLSVCVSVCLFGLFPSFFFRFVISRYPYLTCRCLLPVTAAGSIQHPTEHFTILGASKSVDRRILCSSETSIDGF